MTPALYVALSRFAFLADHDSLDGITAEAERAYDVAAKLLTAAPFGVDDMETLLDVAGASLWARDHDPAEPHLIERGAFLFGAAFMFQMLRGDGR